MKNSADQLEYFVRISPRAKRVTLRITPHEGLVVVIPRGFNKDKVPAIVEGRRNWIENVLSRVIPVSSPDGCYVPPASFFFPLIGRFSDLTGDSTLLRIRKIAEDHIVPLAWKIAYESSLRPGSFTIRNQKSLWGSCSSSGSINLNQKLLFFEPHLVRYVILHELCHLKHRDHSSSFWASLRDLDPYCFVHRKDLRAAQWVIPGWAY